MSRFKSIIARTPTLGRCLLVFYRAKIGLQHFRRPLTDLLRWLFVSRETTNFTYDLDETNKRYLASLIAFIANEKFDVIMAYFKELEADRELQRHIAKGIEKSEFAFVADSHARFGRRVGWYALTRALKPAVIIETGVDKGLGSCVLTAALKRNHEEGYEGRYYGTDINPQAGYLLGAEYANYGRIMFGDSIECLRRFEGRIDLFINDSDHSAEYEAEEYRTIADKLSAKAVILGDNAHCTDKLLEFSLQTKRQFVYFQEKPRRHWYEGAGIGISFARSSFADADAERGGSTLERGNTIMRDAHASGT